MTTLIFLVIITYIIFFAFGFISYAFNSFGLYEIAKKENAKFPAIAWIPYINKFTLGKVAFNSNVHATLLVILNLLSIILGVLLLFVSKNVQAIYSLALASLIISMVTSVYTFIAHYRLYRKYSKSTVIMTIFDVLSFGILGPFFIFAIKGNEENK